VIDEDIAATRTSGLSEEQICADSRGLARQPVLDVIKLVKYRADFYGRRCRQ
jgi:hypothetical protein